MPELFFISFLNRYIDRNTDQARRPSGLIRVSTSPDEHPPGFFAAVGIAKLRFEGSLILLASGKGFLDRSAIAGMNQIQKGFLRPGECPRRQAEDSFKFPGAKELAGLEVVGPCTDHR